MFGAYVKENRKALIALAVYTVVFALVFWLYRLPLGAAGYAALVCLFVLALWFAVDYRRFAARLRLLQRLEQEITLSTEQLPEPDGMLEAQYQALVRALDADRVYCDHKEQRNYRKRLHELYLIDSNHIFHAKNPGKPVRLSDYNQIVRPAHYRAASRLFWNHFHNAELTSLSFYKPVLYKREKQKKHVDVLRDQARYHFHF